MNTRIWEVVYILVKIFLFNMSKYLKYMNTRIWEVVSILEKIFLFNMSKYQIYIYFGWPCSKYLKYMNTHIWKVFFFLSKIYLFLLTMSRYLKYMNTRIWEVFFILVEKNNLYLHVQIPQIHEYAYLEGILYFIKKLFISFVHVLDTPNTWIRVFQRYSFFLYKTIFFFLVSQIHEYVYLEGIFYFWLFQLCFDTVLTWWNILLLHAQ